MNGDEMPAGGTLKAVLVAIRKHWNEEVGEPRAHKNQVVKHAGRTPDARLLLARLTQVFRSYLSEANNRE